MQCSSVRMVDIGYVAAWQIVQLDVFSDYFELKHMKKKINWFVVTGKIK